MPVTKSTIVQLAKNVFCFWTWFRSKKNDDLLKGIEEIPEVFEYFDGEKKTYRDPIVIFKKIDNDIELLTAILPGAIALNGSDFEKIIEYATELLKIKPLDEETGKGLTKIQIQALFVDCLNYLELLKKKHGTLPIFHARSLEEKFSAEVLANNWPSEYQEMISSETEESEEIPHETPVN